MEVGTWPIDEIAEKHNHKKWKTAAIADFST